MFLSNLNLTNEQIAQKENEFQQLLLSPAEVDKTYEELRDFFANPTQSEIKKYRHSYWRWYVLLTWNRLNSLPKDELVSTVFSQQLPIALLIDVDVWKSLMQYFVANNFFEDDLESFYLKIKKAFLESDAVIGEWQGKNVTVAELVKEIGSVYDKEDSLSQADFESKLRQIISPEEEVSKKYFIADPEKTKERFLYLVAFFETFTEENIWYVVDAFLNPEKYQKTASGAVLKPVSSNPPLPRPSGESPKPSTVPLQPAPNKEEPKLVVPPTIRPTPSPAQIKSQIESQFKKDADGNFTDIEGVMAKLNELSEKNNDPKIAEMMYYDETENKFKWNI